MTTSLLTYLGLFAWAFLAATILPVASEPALVAAVLSEGRLVAPVLVATAGNFLGACTTYALARAAARAARSRTEPNARLRRAADFVRRFGPPALLLSWVPILGDALVAAAGAAGMRPVPFALFTLLGKAARYAALAAAVEAA